MEKKVFFFFYNQAHDNIKVRKLAVFFARYAFIVFVTAFLYLVYISSSTQRFLPIYFCFANLFFITVISFIINRTRPFEELQIEPFIYHIKGQSFPSRHSSSAAIISLMFIEINYILAIFLFILSVVLGISRIATGVHYPKDVFFAFLISVLFYIIYLQVI